MKLIDLDKVVTIYDEDNNNAVIFGNIKNAELDAIPIKWLLEERDKNKNIVEKLRKEDLDIDFISKYLYKRASHKALIIEEILLDWRMESKEQGK